MNLTDREKSTLLLDPRTNWNKQALDDEMMWNDCKHELKHFRRAHGIQTKSCYRQNSNDETHLVRIARMMIKLVILNMNQMTALDSLLRELHMLIP